MDCEFPVVNVPLLGEGVSVHSAVCASPTLYPTLVAYAVENVIDVPVELRLLES